jgi:ribokinase
VTGTVTVVGSANVDHIVEVGRLPRPGETVIGGGPRTAPGGKGLNQAISSARQGISTIFVGTVGADAAGAEIRRVVTAEGIESGLLRDCDQATGSAVVLRDENGENCIVVSAGANGQTRASAAQSAAATAGSGDVLLMQLEIPTETVRGTALWWPGVVIVNAAPAGPVPDDLWQSIDLLVVNESELDWYANTVDGDTVSAMERIPARAVITTLGERGCIVRDTDGTVTAIACPEVEVVDTTGAGDAFCGVLAAGIAAGIGITEAARRATIAAALSTLGIGAQTCPRSAEVDAYQGS